MALLIMSILAPSITGAIAVGVRVGSQIEGQDTALISALSQAEHIASLPTASSYGRYPSAPSDLDIAVRTGDAVEGCPNRQFLQCLNIVVGRSQDQTGDSTLDAFKARRFLQADSVLSPNAPDIVPVSGGVERVKTISVGGPLPRGEGFAVVISQVFSSPVPTDILVRWEVNPEPKKEGRALAIYRGRPFGEETDDLTIDPSAVQAPLVAIGNIENNLVLSVASRDVAPGDYTIYFFHSSSQDDDDDDDDDDPEHINTKSVEISCVCKIE